MNPADRNVFFSILQAQNPAPQTELFYKNPYTLLVAVILSAQATDAGVNKATPALFAVADHPAAMLQLGLEGLREKIKTIGLFNAKAKNIIAMSEMLLAQHGGQVPASRESLEALPGVGRKTANVVLQVVFGEATIAVDTHVFRVANRTGLAMGKTPLAVEAVLMRHVPKPYLLHAHHWLILLGRYVCKARQPLCAACAVRQYCRTGKRLKNLPTV